jgi:hypothetical protein
MCQLNQRDGLSIFEPRRHTMAAEIDRVPASQVLVGRARSQRTPVIEGGRQNAPALAVEDGPVHGVPISVGDPRVEDEVSGEHVERSPCLVAPRWTAAVRKDAADIRQIVTDSILRTGLPKPGSSDRITSPP